MEIKEYVKLQKEEIKNKISSLNTKPCFAIIQVNDDPASNSYIRGKMKDAAEVGINCILEKYDATISEEELIKKIEIFFRRNRQFNFFFVNMFWKRHLND